MLRLDDDCLQQQSKATNQAVDLELFPRSFHRRATAAGNDLTASLYTFADISLNRRGTGSLFPLLDAI
ncbi:hypothetical protein CYMTET_49188 [Cymbomonas tetramitiformis]|uniref:Uncharacterized protein n=1 Tax=Cymbomonas tetramitiformis TaxID=36881 RepID=A0AAE0EUT0_9CHLO|nr:hypothetical protein CYMTET_49188 [Cymbomonas tetramitiformis]